MSVNSYDEIIPNLFLGGYKALEDYAKFDLIINCTKDIEFPKMDNTMVENIKMNIRFERLAINDDSHEVSKLHDLLESKNILALINQYLLDNKKVLVHCKMGQQRSAIVIVCYIMRYFYIGGCEAIQYVKNKRPIAFFGKVNFIDLLDRY